MSANIFLVDNYDSFTFNLAEYFKIQGAQVTVFRNDLDPELIEQYDPDLIVLSPGPSVPSNAGNLLQVIERYAGKRPIFGVCLGHQAIIEVMGGQLGFLDYPVHGKASPITHDGKGLFKGLPNPVNVGRYHSLIGSDVPDCLEVTAQSEEGIVMAVEHKQHKVLGVQFHPESILTAKSDHGLSMIANLLDWAKA